MPSTPTTLHDERLWPSPGVWTVLVLLGLSGGIVAGPLGPSVAGVTAVTCTVVLVTAAIAGTPRIRVTPERFVAGRATLPIGLVTGVEALDAEAMRHARGRGLDARAYLCLRGWLPLGVRVGLGDPADPTPYWLVSSRRPADLAAALSTAAGRTEAAGS